MADEIAPEDEPSTEEPKYDQKFFLKLAREGKKDAWNKWRRDPANNDKRVTFAGVDFSEAPWDEIDFSEFEFGDHADFSQCKWRGNAGTEVPQAFVPGCACFIGADFGFDANFTQASFGDWASFDGAAFSDSASFYDATFGATTCFTGATFGFMADFIGATFGDLVNFDNTRFLGFANFRSATFGRDADFTRAAFGMKAIFEDVDFGKRTIFTGAAFGDKASFVGAAFGDEANFTNATFGPEATFAGAAYGEVANFQGANFSVKATFFGAVFGDEDNFNNANFGDEATFDGAVFGRLTFFSGATFGDETTFAGAVFGGIANFSHATFVGAATFAGAAFGTLADFDETHFKGHVEFMGLTIDQWTTDFETSAQTMGPDARTALKKRHEILWKRLGSGPDRFLVISFAHARFDRIADFRRRSFERAADFTNTRFYSPPVFDAATNAARIDFAGTYVSFVPPGKLHWTEDSPVSTRLRAFRKIAEETKNHDLERDLYIEERKAERGVYCRQLSDELEKASWRHRPLIRARLLGHRLWIIVMFFYWALADYGRNFVLPAAWLALSVFLFRWCYGAILAPLRPQAGTLDAAKYARAEWMVALGNAVPFVGPLTIDAEIKKFLFCPGFGKCLPIPPEGFQLLVIAQNVLSITCVFFIGLALRNYFRIK